jgi:hypothetical protein
MGLFLHFTFEYVPSSATKVLMPKSYELNLTDRNIEFLLDSVQVCGTLPSE